MDQCTSQFVFHHHHSFKLNINLSVTKTEAAINKELFCLIFVCDCFLSPNSVSDLSPVCLELVACYFLPSLSVVCARVRSITFLSGHEFAAVYNFVFSLFSSLSVLFLCICDLCISSHPDIRCVTIRVVGMRTASILVLLSVAICVWYMASPTAAISVGDAIRSDRANAPAGDPRAARASAPRRRSNKRTGAVKRKRPPASATKPKGDTQKPKTVKKAKTAGATNDRYAQPCPAPRSELILCWWID